MQIGSFIIIKGFPLHPTGWPKSKFANSNGYNFVNMHFWPHVGKAKMCLGVVSLHSLKNCKQTAENCKQTAEKSK